MGGTTTRVILADPDPYSHAAIDQELRKIPSLSVIAHASTISALEEAVLHRNATSLIFDPVIGDQSCRVIPEMVANTDPQARAIALTRTANPEEVKAAIRAGVTAFVLKDDAKGRLHRIIPAVVRGERYLSPALNHALCEALAEPQPAASKLTARELEILECVAMELSSKEIAQRLNLNPRTVDAHRMNIMRKLDAHTIAGLVLHAVQRGLISPR
jgi:DNA-binding NarL/FixJ family response regulator